MAGVANCLFMSMTVHAYDIVGTGMDTSDAIDSLLRLFVRILEGRAKGLILLSLRDIIVGLRDATAMQ